MWSVCGHRFLADMTNIYSCVPRENDKRNSISICVLKRSWLQFCPSLSLSLSSSSLMDDWPLSLLINSSRRTIFYQDLRVAWWTYKERSDRGRENVDIFLSAQLLQQYSELLLSFPSQGRFLIGRPVSVPVPSMKMEATGVSPPPPPPVRPFVRPVRSSNSRQRGESLFFFFFRCQKMEPCLSRKI